MKRGMMVIGLWATIAAGAWAADFTTWADRMPITFTGYAKSNTLTNFPVLVTLSNNVNGSGFDYGDFASTNSADLRFSDASGTTELNYEIEKWNPSGTSYVWVQVPALAGTNTTIWAYWGKQGVTAPAYTTSGATWSNGFEAVWHMASNYTADSSGNNHYGLVGGGGNIITQPDVVGDGQHLLANDTTLTFTNFDTFAPAKFSVSFWINPDYIFQSRPRLSATSDIAGIRGFAFATSDPSGIYAGIYPARFEPDGVHMLHVGQWTYVTYTQDLGANQGYLYLDGVYAEGPIAVIQPAAWGALELGYNAVFFMGSYMDEMRVSTVARSADWIWAEHINMVSNAAFNSCGTVRGTENLAGWARRMPITFSGYTNAETLNDFPALVILSNNVGNSGFSYAAFSSPSGADLRFTDGSKTHPIPYDIETWNPAGVSYVWVRVPTLSGTNTTIWMYWAAPGATAPAYAVNGATWSNGYEAVWHMTTINTADSAGNNHNGMASGNNSIQPGVVGDGQLLPQDATTLTFTNFDTFAPSKFTVSFWINPLGIYDARPCLGSPVGWTAFQFSTYGSSWTGSTTGIFVGVTGDYRFNPDGVHKLYVGTWTYVTYTHDVAANQCKLYLDGQLAQGPQGAVQPVAWGTFRLGADATFFMGSYMDEIRISTAARTPGWIWAEWMNMSSNATFNTFGEVLNSASRGTIITFD